MSLFETISIKPLLSIIIIICTFFLIVFLQMEERRLSYLSLKLIREHRALMSEKRDLEIQRAKITRPQLLEKMAQHNLTLKRAQAHQIIQLAGDQYHSNKDD